jgi:hypothetical protein
LASVHLEEVNAFVGGLAAISEVLTCFRDEVGEVINRVYPDYANFVIQNLSFHQGASPEFYAQSVQRAVEGQGHIYQALSQHYQQLQDFFPRYSALMNRSRTGGSIAEFAAGFFGGYLGVVGAEMWENWRNTNDQEFHQKFCAAIDNYVQRSIEFVNGGEEALNVIFDRLIEDIEEYGQLLFTAYSQLGDKGVDLKPLYLEHRKPPEVNEQVRQLYAVAIQNLSENRSIPNKRLMNIKQMIGI